MLERSVSKSIVLSSAASNTSAISTVSRESSAEIFVTGSTLTDAFFGLVWGEGLIFLFSDPCGRSPVVGSGVWGEGLIFLFLDYCGRSPVVVFAFLVAVSGLRRSFGVASTFLAVTILSRTVIGSGVTISVS